MIKKIIINNFKSIEHTELNIQRVNILVGGNNSGKTSILQAIQFGCSILQTINITVPIPWRITKDFTRSIEPNELVYSPLKDVSALARGGELKQGERYIIKLKYINDNDEVCNVSIKRGRNRNIAATINKSKLTQQFVSIEKPMCVFVPGLAGIPYNEEFKSESIVRKAAAKGDANSVLRNILLLLKQSPEEWNTFLSELQEIFPNITIEIKYLPKTDDYIDVRVIEKTYTIDNSGNTTYYTKNLPIDAVGTGVLQAIQILSYINLYQPQLLILDEPDAHLHPNNQRKILNMLYTLAEKKDFQLLISTHSRHVLDTAENNANIIWVKNGKCVEEDISYLKLLMDLGALDSGDLLKNGLIKCVFLTEDETDKNMLEMVIKASGFDLSETDIWSYNGCTKVETALILAEFIKKHAPSVKVVIHRDRDFMTNEEMESYKHKVCVNNNYCFLTKGSDIESYYLSPEHLSKIYNQFSIEDSKKIIQQATDNKQEKSIEKFINSRDGYEKIYCRASGKNSYNVGKLAQECADKYKTNPEYYRHGKTVFKELKNLLQNDYKIKSNLIVSSEFLLDSNLESIANEIWNI